MGVAQGKAGGKVGKDKRMGCMHGVEPYPRKNNNRAFVLQTQTDRVGPVFRCLVGL